MNDCTCWFVRNPVAVSHSPCPSHSHFPFLFVSSPSPPTAHMHHHFPSTALKALNTLALANFALPGDGNFPLNAMYDKPRDKTETGSFRSLMAVFLISYRFTCHGIDRHLYHSYHHC